MYISREVLGTINIPNVVNEPNVQKNENTGGSRGVNEGSKASKDGVLRGWNRKWIKIRNKDWTIQ